MCYCNGMETYELIRSGRKTLALEITRDCRVVVRAPRRLSQARIDDFVASHAGWIARHLEQQRKRNRSDAGGKKFRNQTNGITHSCSPPAS